jgi:phosphoribosylformylglycinamidine synthase
MPVAATNNLNFGNPERPEIMAQLVESIQGLGEACRFFETPITGGNVSLYNETLGEAIWPTPVIGLVGLMQTAQPVTIPFKEEGRAVVLLGGYGSADEVRFGGTQYAKAVLRTLWGLPPALDMEYEKRVHAAIREVVTSGLAESSHDVGEGGLAVALAECCANGIGAGVELTVEQRPELAPFHEGPSRVVVSTAAAEAIEKIAAKHRVECVRLGVTMKEKLRVTLMNGDGTKTLIDVPVKQLREVWENALEGMLNPVHA